jgi:transcriptional regulator with XRE-family HTH domain
MVRGAKDFGKFMRDLRLKRKFTITHLSRESGISTEDIESIEKGKGEIPLPGLLRKLAKALDVRFQQLMVAAGYWESHEINQDLCCMIWQPDLRFLGNKITEEQKLQLAAILEVLFDKNWRYGWCKK